MAGGEESSEPAKATRTYTQLFAARLFQSLREEGDASPQPLELWLDLAAAARVERSGRRATESFESLHIRIRVKFCQNSGYNLTILPKF